MIKSKDQILTIDIKLAYGKGTMIFRKISLLNKEKSLALNNKFN